MDAFADGDAGGVDVYAGSGLEGLQHLSAGAHCCQLMHPWAADLSVAVDRYCNGRWSTYIMLLEHHGTQVAVCCILFCIIGSVLIVKLQASTESRAAAPVWQRW